MHLRPDIIKIVKELEEKEMPITINLEEDPFYLLYFIRNTPSFCLSLERQNATPFKKGELKTKILLPHILQTG